MNVYVSGYTNEISKGIYGYFFNSTSGSLTPKGLVIESVNPSFFTTHNNNLYTVNEVGEYKGQPTGYVSTYYKDDKTGKLVLINEQPSGGQDPCHVTCDKSGKYLYVANYSGGSASVFPILSPGSPKSSLGEMTSNVFDNATYKASFGVPDRQEKPHVHSINLDPIAQKYVFTNDLGCDVLVTYKFDRKDGQLLPHSSFEFPAGTGPRHLKFAPNNNNFCYLISELSNDIYMLEFNFHQGEFNQVQKIHGLPKDFKGENLGAEIDIHPNGKFLYASMRGYDAISIFKIDGHSGKLTTVGYQNTGGKHPRHFTIDPTGNYLIVGNKVSL